MSAALGQALLDAGLLGAASLVWCRIGAAPGPPPPALGGMDHPEVRVFGLWASQAGEEDPPDMQGIPGDYGIVPGRIGGDGALYLRGDPASASTRPAVAGEGPGEDPRGALTQRDVRVVALDRIIAAGGMPTPDVLELTLSGAVGDALRGASWALRRGVCAVFVEVPFSPERAGEAPFSEVDALLRDRDFHLYDLSFTKLDAGPLRRAAALYLKGDGDRREGLPSPGLRLRMGIVSALCGQGPLARARLSDAEGSWTGAALQGRIDACLAAHPAAPPAPPAADPPWARMLPPGDGRRIFLSPVYGALNDARGRTILETGILKGGGDILEVGAGAGALTALFLKENTHITPTDGRPGQVEILRARFPQLGAHRLDVEDRSPPARLYEGVLCFGLLNHLGDPAGALGALAERADGWLVVECPVAPGEGVSLTRVKELGQGQDGALRGVGCLPTRGWVVAQLRALFPFVYAPARVPEHPDFRGDAPRRALLIGSRAPLPAPPWAPIPPAAPS